MKYLLLLFVLFVPLCEASRAADPFLKPNDVIALVGGEDMVAASEYGYLELLLQRALPQYHLKVRSLAWEGDTVFEQPRDLNYPTLEQQLDDLGATVVIMQFGQMESLAGTSKLPEFIKAYEKLIERVSGGGKRRVVLISPHSVLRGSALFEREVDRVLFDNREVQRRDEQTRSYVDGVKTLAEKAGTRFVSAFDHNADDVVFIRDGIHSTASGQSLTAQEIAANLGVLDMRPTPADLIQQLSSLIRAKNRYWFNYTRPQNWAFLNGDRTEQPSSRDHLDPSKRWFPEEMKQWLPLIDAKEKEIWDLAAKTANGESTKATNHTK